MIFIVEAFDQPFVNMIPGDEWASELLHRVISRRRGQCELNLMAMMLALLKRDRGLLEILSPTIKFKFEAALHDVS